MVFGGDNRQNGNGTAIFDKTNTRYRLRQTGRFIPLEGYDADGLKDGSATNLPGVTTKYAAAAVVGGQIPPGTVPLATGTADISRMTVTAIRQDTRLVLAKFRMEANNPLVDGSPDIEVIFDLILDYTDPRNPQMSLASEHKWFPCFDIYVNGQSVYPFDSENATVLSLAGPRVFIQFPFRPIELPWDDEQVNP